MPQQLLEVMSSRKRRPNWTDQECLLLAQLMHERKAIIKGKCSTGVTIQDKRQAWEEIAQAVNKAFPQFQRTVSDCNKKWENLLAKSREEIKRQKKHTEGLSIEKLSTVTQVVLSVMTLSNLLQQGRDDSTFSEVMQNQQNSSDEDGNNQTTDERITTEHPVTELHLPSYPDLSTSPIEQKVTVLTNVPKILSVQFSAPHAAGFTATTEQQNAPCSTSTPAARGMTLQERMDLEMSVLRRQETVLRLQEEYYTLKIKLMKKRLEEKL